MATLLLKEDDITKNTPIGGNVETSRLIPAIKSAQITAIKPLMGEAFYAELVEKFKTDDLSTEYETLYEDYIKPMLIHLSTAYYFTYGAYNIGNKGIYKATGADSEGVNKDEVDYLVKAQEKQYESYKRGYFAFMEANAKLFPLYSAEETRLTKRQNYGGWTFGNTGKGGGTAKAMGITNAQYLAILERLDLLDLEVDERVFTVSGVNVDNTDPLNPIITGGAGGSVNWGGIGGNLSNQTDLQALLDTLVVKVTGSSLISNQAITRLANTSGTNTGDQDLSGKVDKVAGSSLIENASILRLANTSGTNTGDQDLSGKVDKVAGSSLISNQAITRLQNTSGINTGDQDLSGKVNSIVANEPTGSDKVVNIVSLTQAEYDAGTPVADTFYIIT